MDHSERAFTVLELVIGLAITVLAVGIGYGVLFQGSRAYSRASERLELLRSARAVFDAVLPDVRAAVSNIDVTPDSRTLSIRRVRFGTLVPPRSGGAWDLETVKYSYDHASGVLKRNDQEVAGNIPDLRFRIELVSDPAAPGTPPFPVVTAEVNGLSGTSLVTFAGSASPRFVGAWAADPRWVYAGVWGPYTFTQAPQGSQ